MCPIRPNVPSSRVFWECPACGERVYDRAAMRQSDAIDAACERC